MRRGKNEPRISPIALEAVKRIERSLNKGYDSNAIPQAYRGARRDPTFHPKLKLAVPQSSTQSHQADVL
jgi:hypothetical protein